MASKPVPDETARDVEVEMLAAPGWRPDEQPTIAGVPRIVDFITSEYGSYPVITVRVTDAGTGDVSYVNVHAFHEILREALRQKAALLDAAIKNQTEMTITAGVTRPSKKRTDAAGNPTQYHPYTVFFAGETVESAADWASRI